MLPRRNISGGRHFGSIEITICVASRIGRVTYRSENCPQARLSPFPAILNTYFWSSTALLSRLSCRQCLVRPPKPAVLHRTCDDCSGSISSYSQAVTASALAVRADLCDAARLFRELPIADLAEATRCPGLGRPVEGGSRSAKLRPAGAVRRANQGRLSRMPAVLSPHATFTILFPLFSPASSPIRARGVFSSPSMMSSCTMSLPASTQDLSSAIADARSAS